MLPIAGQTARPFGLTFFVDTPGLKAIKFELFFLHFFPRATPSPSANIYKYFKLNVNSNIRLTFIL